MKVALLNYIYAQSTNRLTLGTPINHLFARLNLAEGIWASPKLPRNPPRTGSQPVRPPYGCKDHRN